MRGSPRRRRTVSTVAAVVAFTLAAAGVALFELRTSRASVVTGSGDLEAFVRSFVSRMPRPESNGYDQPTPDEQAQMANAFRAIQQGRLEEAATAVAPLHYEVVRFTDTATGRGLVMLEEIPGSDGSWPHGWGLYVFAPSSSSHLLVDVAHPFDDIKSELVGVATFRQANAAALLVAGTSRYADDGDIADMAHDSFSVFEAIHEELLTPDSVVFEPHGFETADHTDHGDVVVSSGTTPPGEVARSVAEALAKAGFRVCLYDGVNCSDLGGTTNVQGVSTRAAGAEFLHIEMAMGVRAAPARRDAVAEAVTRATT